jgi:antirestriction protein ArdC
MDNLNNSSNNQSKTRELLQKLKHGIQEVKSSDDFKRYLKAMSLFHHYSWCNCLLIAMQCPKATNVAGYQTWKKLGRQVKKGEKGISIFAPMRVKQQTNESEDEIDYVTLFRVVYVFDISQTEGDPLPEPPNFDIQDTHSGLLPSLIRFAESKNIKVSFEELTHCEGVSQLGHIIIQRDKNSTEQALILIHEIAHELIHNSGQKRHELTTEQKELEAEATSFVVSNQLGLPETHSDKYLALYEKSYDLQLSLEFIHAAAQEILHREKRSKRLSKPPNQSIRKVVNEHV